MASAEVAGRHHPTTAIIIIESTQDEIDLEARDGESGNSSESDENMSKGKSRINNELKRIKRGRTFESTQSSWVLSKVRPLFMRLYSGWLSTFNGPSSLYAFKYIIDPGFSFGHVLVTFWAIPWLLHLSLPSQFHPEYFQWWLKSVSLYPLTWWNWQLTWKMSFQNLIVLSSLQQTSDMVKWSLWQNSWLTIEEDLERFRQ